MLVWVFVFHDRVVCEPCPTVAAAKSFGVNVIYDTPI